MQLLELFNHPQKLKISKNTSEEFAASAVFDGRRFKYSANLADERSDAWDVDFADDQGYEHTTGKGSALEVLATAHKFVELFIKHREPTIIEFSATLKNDGEKSARPGVYTKLFSRDSLGYKLEFKDSDYERLFKLTSPNKKK